LLAEVEVDMVQMRMLVVEVRVDIGVVYLGKVLVVVQVLKQH
jgi:hypothetical protein